MRSFFCTHIILFHFSSSGNLGHGRRRRMSPLRLADVPPPLLQGPIRDFSRGANLIQRRQRVLFFALSLHLTATAQPVQRQTDGEKGGKKGGRRAPLTFPPARRPLSVLRGTGADWSEDEGRMGPKQTKLDLWQQQQQQEQHGGGLERAKTTLAATTTTRTRSFAFGEGEGEEEVWSWDAARSKSMPEAVAEEEEEEEEGRGKLEPHRNFPHAPPIQSSTAASTPPPTPITDAECSDITRTIVWNEPRAVFFKKKIQNSPARTQMPTRTLLTHITCSKKDFSHSREPFRGSLHTFSPPHFCLSAF